jgi:hypothetical protein
MPASTSTSSFWLSIIISVVTDAATKATVTINGQTGVVFLEIA